MGVRSQKIERLPGLDEDEKLAELISVRQRKDWEALWSGGLWRAWGVYSVFILEDVASLAADRGL